MKILTSIFPLIASEYELNQNVHLRKLKFVDIIKFVHGSVSLQFRTITHHKCWTHLTFFFFNSALACRNASFVLVLSVTSSRVFEIC